jgi:hypothetical protein
MSKKDILMKGFNNLLQSTETKVEPFINKDINEIRTYELSNIQAAKSIDVQKYKRLDAAKYKELKKCTLYLPPDIMDSLAILKVRTKKDLSVLTAEALTEYLQKYKYLNI